jgi:hypothetical protein
MQLDVVARASGLPVGEVEEADADRDDLVAGLDVLRDESRLVDRGTVARAGASAMGRQECTDGRARCDGASALRNIPGS